MLIILYVKVLIKTRQTKKCQNPYPRVNVLKLIKRGGFPFKNGDFWKADNRYLDSLRTIEFDIYFEWKLQEIKA